MTKAEGGCKCEKLSPTSATCVKKFNLMNILRQCPSNFVAKPAPGYSATFWLHNPCNMRRRCCVASVSKNVPSVAAALFLLLQTVRLFLIFCATLLLLHPHYQSTKFLRAIFTSIVKYSEQSLVFLKSKTRDGGLINFSNGVLMSRNFLKPQIIRPNFFNNPK